MTAMSVERATAFGESWNSGNPDLVASYFTDDGIFYSSSGPDVYGRSYVGKDGIRQAARDFNTRYPGGRFENLEVFVSGDTGIFKWEIVAPDGSGGETRQAGCDLLEFKGDLVYRKSAYQKRRG